VDLLEPVEVVPLGGARCAVGFTDKTRWRSTCFTGKKSGTLKRLQDCVDDTNGLLKGQQVRGLRSGGGGEFVAGALKKWCKQSGVLQTLSAPYSSPQNGVAGRTRRTTMEVAMCLLLGSGLGKELWAEATSTATCVTSRTPSSALNGDTPYRAVFGKQPQTEHTRILGCRAHCQVYSRGRQKLDHKVWRGTLVGYGEHSRACYRTRDPPARVVRKTARVTFDEAVYPARASPTSSSGGSGKDSAVPKQEAASDSGEQSVGADTGGVLDRSVKLNGEVSVVGSGPVGDHEQEPPEWL